MLNTRCTVRSGPHADRYAEQLVALPQDKLITRCFPWPTTPFIDRILTNVDRFINPQSCCWSAFPSTLSAHICTFDVISLLVSYTIIGLRSSTSCKNNLYVGYDYYNTGKRCLLYLWPSKYCKYFLTEWFVVYYDDFCCIWLIHCTAAFPALLF